VNAPVLWGILISVVVGLLAAAGCYLVNRFLPEEGRADDVEVIGFVFCIVGVLYAIVLAFVLVEVWTKYTAAQTAASAEATALIEQYRYAQLLPEGQRGEIEGLARQYATFVIGTEWPQLKERAELSPQGYQILDELRAAVQNSRPELVGPADNPVTEQANLDAYSGAVLAGDALASSRQERLATATAGVPSVIWVVLIGGLLLSVGQSFIFRVGGIVTQLVLTVGLTVMTTLIVWSIWELEYPFSRALAVGPEAFEFAVARFAQLSG
jgi:hypothetical protein